MDQSIFFLWLWVVVSAKHCMQWKVYNGKCTMEKSCCCKIMSNYYSFLYMFVKGFHKIPTLDISIALACNLDKVLFFLYEYIFLNLDLQTSTFQLFVDIKNLKGITSNGTEVFYDIIVPYDYGDCFSGPHLSDDSWIRLGL